MVHVRFNLVCWKYHATYTGKTKQNNMSGLPLQKYRKKRVFGSQVNKNGQPLNIGLGTTATLSACASSLLSAKFPNSK